MASASERDGAPRLEWLIRTVGRRKPLDALRRGTIADVANLQRGRYQHAVTNASEVTASAFSISAQSTQDAIRRLRQTA